MATLTAALVFVEPTVAAIDVTVSVSPTQGVVGRPIEVLVRTYVPFRAGDLQLPVPSLDYPVASGLWDVLYPFPDFSPTIETHSPAGASTTIELVRDPSDASLWRATFTPDQSGDWTVALRGSPDLVPTRISVMDGDTVPSAAVASVVALLVGLLLGLSLSRVRQRARRSPDGT